jgi:hypothetical protein
MVVYAHVSNMVSFEHNVIYYNSDIQSIFCTIAQNVY